MEKPSKNSSAVTSDDSSDESFDPIYNGVWARLYDISELKTRSGTYVLAVPGGVLIRYGTRQYAGDDETENVGVAESMCFLPGAKIDDFHVES